MTGAAGHPAYGELRAVTESASVLLADNPSPMTLEGTNTWVLRAPGEAGCVVIDPGPLDEPHLARVAAHGPVRAVLLTHGHPDHAEGARRFGELVGAPVRALDPALRLGEEGLTDGDVVAAAGVEIRVLGTPGHTADSLSFVLHGPGGASVLTGDTVLGRGTTVVAHPDGRLADYLVSLRRLAELPEGTAVLPGHGPELPDAGTVARQYLAHREQRLEQVRAALAELDGLEPAEGAGAARGAGGAGGAGEQLGGSPSLARRVVERVYADVDPVLWPAAELSVRAQLDYLREQAG
ncbi:MAG TPA: MBL fold metallo-hydrolase [Pseudonocardiaceae bacterium]|nr:MBL fold metallo-hydrolase [Pseudonocardiaceae bacterium]